VKLVTASSSGGEYKWTVTRWLEAWFALGELMIARRERFQRVYDLRRRVLEGTPWGSLDDDDLPSSAALRRAFALGGVRALGVAQARWIADYFRCKPSFTDAELATWVETGDLVQVAVAGWERAAYVHREHRELLARAVAGRLRATHTALLSPFDPVVWDRARALEMFGFDYRIECYTPAAKRRYGYFALPILHGDRLIGRLDAKAHRAAGVFEVIAVHFESGVEVDERMAAALATTIQTTALWHGTPKVRLGSVVPARARASLRSCLAGAMER